MESDCTPKSAVTCREYKAPGGTNINGPHNNK